MLQYGLLENLLTPAPDDCTGVPQNVRSYTMDEILDMMMERGTTITRTDVKAVIQLYKEVIVSLVADGAAVNTELMNVSPSISGVFNNADDMFDASRHRVNVNLSPGKALLEARARIAVQKVQMVGSAPYLSGVYDAVTGEANSTLVAGNVLRISGARLRFLADVETNGVFLVTPEGVAKRCPTVIENKPGRLMVLVPADTTPGDYYVEVRTTYAASSPKEAKTLKTGRYAKPVAVVAAS